MLKLRNSRYAIKMNLGLLPKLKIITDSLLPKLEDRHYGLVLICSLTYYINSSIAKLLALVAGIMLGE